MAKLSQLYKEARRLHQMGFATHWLHPKSKRPIESGWGSGPRKDWNYLNETYIEGLNLGVRLGTPSKIGRGFLAVVDVDVKSTTKEHRLEALQAARELLGASANGCPTVTSGRGNGSRHYYCLTAQPFKTWNPAQSKDIVKVHMPSKKPSKKEIAELSEKEIAEGIRLSHAWEISLYSDGRQVVLPPSIHPDTGKPYAWKVNLDSVSDLPLVTFPDEPVEEKAAGETSVGDFAGEAVNDIEFSKVDLEWLPISDAVRDAIIDGKDVSDRSGYLLVAATALHSAGLTRDEILSVLTEPKTFLGACAYDHAKTTSRKRAAQWLWKYTLRKVLFERSGENYFTPASEIEPARKLSAQEVEKQNADFLEDYDWRREIVRTGTKGDGPPKSSVENVVLILVNSVSPKIVKRNEFAFRDHYGVDTPWGGKDGEVITDDDVAKIKYWLGQRWRFEPSDKVIFDALIVIACRNAYDPIIDWLDALPAWDEKPRLSSWLSENFEAEGCDEYLDQVFTKWLVGMVMRAKRPGSKFDWMPIFEGPQGAGKSSFGRLLVGEQYFLDWLPNLADKDSALALQGMWGVELGELANMRKSEIETVKAYITRTVDKVRPPFGKRWLESPRRCVFFGTTNRSTYLTDDTGNRRFKPVKVGRLSFKALRADRHQLFAEALALFNQLEATGELSQYFDLTGKARDFETQIHGEKMVEDESHVMFEAMQDFVKKVEKGEADFDFQKFRILELFGGGGPLFKWQQNTRNLMFAAKMLKKFGGERRVLKGYSFWKIDEGGTSDSAGHTQDFY